MHDVTPSPRRLLAILSYHKVGDAPRGAWEPWNYVSQGMLEEQLSSLREGGWIFVDDRTALRGLDAPESLPVRSALVTFDDGYRSLLERGVPVLHELGCPAVAFVPAAFVGGVNEFDRGLSEPLESLCTWDELLELVAAGISVQSHGFEHLSLSEADGELMEDELRRSKEVLEERIGKPVEMFAFPYGDAGTDQGAVERTLEEVGYGAACLYGGGPVALPAAERYRLSRLAVGSDTDVIGELTAAAVPADDRDDH
jgi:peptidoglycan/xylan/chitin deacetylase (PgdA/CDA1 family)